MNSDASEVRINPPQRENFERLIQLFLKMSLIGFDELEMSERTEVVQLFGQKVKYDVDDFYHRLTALEEKVQFIENKMS